MHDMTPAQRDRLATSLTEAFIKIGTKDVLTMLTMMMTTESLKIVALDVLRTFIVAEGYSLR